jgi:hypothetical protein
MFPGIETDIDLINLISVMISSNPDATIVAREVMFSSVKQNVDCNQNASFLCDFVAGLLKARQSQTSIETQKQTLMDFVTGDRIYYVGNVSKDMNGYPNNKHMTNQFCSREKLESCLVFFKSDYVVQNFLHFYESSDNFFRIPKYLPIALYFFAQVKF